MSKVLLIVDMTDNEYKLFNTFYKKEIMNVDIGYYYDAMEGWSYLRKKLLCAKPIPEPKDEHVKMDNWELGSIINAESRGYNKCLDEILGENDE